MNGMTEIPRASILEAWTVATTQRMTREHARSSDRWPGRAEGRPEARHAGAGSRRADALLRLALDPAATRAERSLAAAKAAELLRAYA